MIEKINKRPNGHYVDGDGNLVHVADGQYHNEDGPAIEYEDGTADWFVNGVLHRLDGPARVWLSHGPSREWCIHGISYDFDDYVIQARWTDEQIVEWKLTHEGQY